MEGQQVSRLDAEDFLTAQREVIDLTALQLRRRYIDQPVRSVLSFGAGEPAEQTLIGNDEHPFYGVTVFNNSPKTVFVGFQAGAAQGSGLSCPPYSMLNWPARYVQLSLGVGVADAAGAQAQVTVLRLQAPPPEPVVLPLGDLSNPAVGADSQRTPSIWVPLPLAGIAVLKETRKALWTPKAGKRFRLLGFVVASSAAMELQLQDGEAGVFTMPLETIATIVAPPMGNGYLSLAAGNALNAFSSAAGNVFGTFWGTEE